MKLLNRRWIGLSFGLALLVHSSIASAVAPGQVDTFEDGTTQNWVVAVMGATHPAPPVNVASGGPAGAADNYLQLTSLGSGGPGSRMAVFNLTQWTGNFIDAEVTAIRMDVNNLGATSLDLRLAFANSGDLALSTVAVTVPPGSGWVSIVFPINPADLTAASGTIVGALSNTTNIRLFHSPTAAFPGPSVVASLGVDNIRAVSTRATAPALSPGMMAALTMMLGILGLRRLRQRELPSAARL